MRNSGHLGRKPYDMFFILDLTFGVRFMLESKSSENIKMMQK